MQVNSASGSAPFIPQTAPVQADLSKPHEKGTPILNLPVEIRHQFFKQGGSLAHFIQWLGLNWRLHAEGLGFSPANTAEHVNHAVCKWMEDYYKAQQDPKRASQLPADYQKLLKQTKAFFSKVQHVRLGLAYSEAGEGSTGIPAPSYWPSQRIKPSNLPDLLAQLDGKTDLKTLEVGLGADQLQPAAGVYAYPIWEPYEKPVNTYSNEPGQIDSGTYIEQIVAKLAEIKRNNPQCEISLSFSCAYGWTEAGPDIRERLADDFFSALQKHPGVVSTLNIITDQEDIVEKAADIAAHDKAMRTIRFHLHMSKGLSEISRHFSGAMVNSIKPLSLECHIHPSWNSEDFGYAENEELLMQLLTQFGNVANMENLAKQREIVVRSIKTMMIDFAKSPRAQSLRLIVPPRLVEDISLALGKKTEFDALLSKLISNNEMSESSWGEAEQFLKSGLVDLKERGKFRFECAVKYSCFKGKKNMSLIYHGSADVVGGAQGGFPGVTYLSDVSECEILLWKNVPEGTDNLNRIQELE